MNAVAYVRVFVDFARKTNNMTLILRKAFYVYKIFYDNFIQDLCASLVSMLPSFLLSSFSQPAHPHIHISSEITLCNLSCEKKLCCKKPLTSNCASIHSFPSFFPSSIRNNGNRKIIRYQIDLELFANCKMIFKR